MSLTVVVSQPMFLPWIGLFEQIRLADVFIHYDDVQLPQGRSFMTRVQVKTPSGISWLSAPIDRKRSGALINESFFASYMDWKEKHLKTILHCYAKAPFFETMFEIAQNIYGYQTDNLSEFNRHTLEYLSRWLGLSTKFVCSSELIISGSSTHRLVELCRHFNADTYVTGLGALNYIDYNEFEANGISVRYMNYEKKAYPQLHGEFTPYVSILDAVANCGSDTPKLITSESIYWKDYHVS